MIRMLVTLLVLFSWPARADDVFPALYDVVGVASHDKLNIRWEPTANSVTGVGIPAHQKGVEILVLSEDGQWGRVSFEGASGWVSMRYLRRLPGQTYKDWRVTPTKISPYPLACYGTEPFWSLKISTDGTLFFTDYTTDTPSKGSFYGVPSSRGSYKFGLIGYHGESERLLVAAFTKKDCSDGMSEGEYRIALDLLREGSKDLQVDTGCCYLVSDIRL